MFDTIIGQETAKETIGAMIESGRIPHALLFVGPHGVGKGELALEFARMLLCGKGALSGCSTCSACIKASKLEHPDLHVLFPSVGESSKKWLEEYITRRQQLAAEPYAPIVYEKGRQILVGLTREVYEKLQETSFEGGRKVCIVLQADRMNASTANTLLKILEEPPDGVHFILTTERLSSVLPTISSRASVVRFRRLRDKEISDYLEKQYGMDPETGSSYAAMAEGSLKTAKALAFENKAEIRSRAFELYRKVALGKQSEIISQAFPFMWSRDVEEAEELIGGFTHCTRSVMDAKYGQKKRTDAFSDTAAHLSQSTDVRALRDLAVKLEDGLEMLGRNVNISTVMISIVYGIHDAYRH